MYVKLIVSNCANDVAFGLTRCERVPFGVKVSPFSVTTKLLSHAVIATLSGDNINLFTAKEDFHWPLHQMRLSYTSQVQSLLHLS